MLAVQSLLVLVVQEKRERGSGQDVRLLRMFQWVPGGAARSSFAPAVAPCSVRGNLRACQRRKYSTVPYLLVVLELLDPECVEKGSVLTARDCRGGVRAAGTQCCQCSCNCESWQEEVKTCTKVGWDEVD